MIILSVLSVCPTHMALVFKGMYVSICQFKHLMIAQVYN